MSVQVPLTTGASLDLGELVEVRAERDHWPSGYLDPATGETYYTFMFEGGAIEGLDGPGDDWLEIDHEDESRAAYEDMVDFAEAVADPRLRDRLLHALEGKGAFRRFRDTMYRDAGETTGRAWNAYRDACDQLRALRWLEGTRLVDGAVVGQTQVALREAAAEALGTARAAGR